MTNPPSPISNSAPDVTSPVRPCSSSLLFSATDGNAQQRKSRCSEINAVETTATRVILSMPPPASKPALKASIAASTTFRPVATDGSSGFAEHTPRAEIYKSPSNPETESTSAGLSSEIDNTESPRPPCFSPLAAVDRTSFASLYSLGFTSQANANSSAPPSVTSSIAGSIQSVPMDSSTPTPMPHPSPRAVIPKADVSALPSIATDSTFITANSDSTHQLHPAKAQAASSPQTIQHRPLDTWTTGPLARQTGPRRSTSKHRKAPGTSGSVNGSSTSSDRNVGSLYGKLGVCALDVKARSKASRNILTRIASSGEFEVIIFGDKVILDEDVENWPTCDYFISFFSDGFPLDKAIAYTALRKPFTVNDLPMQKILWDRRLCLRVLDKIGVRTPQRIEVNRDGGPRVGSRELADHLFKFSGVRLEGPAEGTGGGMLRTKEVCMTDDEDGLIVDGVVLRKPFVEKPISGEDHNIYIYFPSTHLGGGGRRLFRKIGNKSSEWDPNLRIARAVTQKDTSYLYEQFLRVDNAEDIKAYTVGPDFCHAETRTSPVLDGLVRRNTHGKEIRYICNLTPEEEKIARKIPTAFGQRVCGFDMLRVHGQSYVIDVNGWSFVKDNNDYYDKCTSILKKMFKEEKNRRESSTSLSESESVTEASERKPEAEPHRKSTLSSHRHDFVKKLMRSPSVSKLRQQQQHTVSLTGSSTSTAETSAATSPLASPPPTSEYEARSKQLHKQLESSSNQRPPTSTAQLSPSIESVPKAPEPASKHSWKLKGMVSVVRHADRTPKQKLKFTFHTEPFVELLKGHQEEVLLKGEAALNMVLDAAKQAAKEGIEDSEKLNLLRTSLARKGAWLGTKVQIKPMFRKRKIEEMTIRADKEVEEIVEGEVAEGPLSRPVTRSDSSAGTTLSRFAAAENDLVLDKLQLIVKWGGEPTHAARYQSQDLGENMREDLLLMNKEALENVRIFSSSERRVTTSAQIWAASFLNQSDIPESKIKIRKDLLDDSNAAKDVMDKVKRSLKLLLREGHKAPPQFAWPANTPEPWEVVRQVSELMVFHRKVMRHNFKRLEGGAAASLSALSKNDGTADPGTSTKSLSQAQSMLSIQPRWCCGENPELFRERWEKLFTEFCDSEKIDPSKISELYDSMKFDALHNRQFLEWVFTPTADFMDEFRVPSNASTTNVDDDGTGSVSGATTASTGASKSQSRVPSGSTPGQAHSRHERRPSAGATSDKSNIVQRMGIRRRSVMNPPSSPSFQTSLEGDQPPESYFKLYSGTGQTRAKQDTRLEKLRELYKLAKVLFDFVCPQEYGISNEEKLEIGLLTSLPLLKEIVRDLEEVQSSEDAKSFVYFTKESHIYTLLNCILEGGMKTKIERNAIPELDYLSLITFELYEAEDPDANLFRYSIRISITPGCHTSDPLDLQLDSKHSIGCAPRRTLTAHSDWMEVIETLRAKFHTVKLPKSFLAVNVSASADDHNSSSAPASNVESEPVGGTKPDTDTTSGS